MPDLLRVAAIQLNSAADLQQNLQRVKHWLQEAAQAGAQLAVLPENFAFMGGDEQQKRAVAENQHDSQILNLLSAQAAALDMAIIGGTVLFNGHGGRLRNSSAAFDTSGKLLSIYDKIHLFDMDYQGQSYHESLLIEAGERPTSIDLDGWRIGLSTCYDLRFPELFRLHADAGCQILCNMAAFTAVTGAAHWQPLLRARAIENQCYVIAAAQWGKHADGRETWGHSLVIDPWGEVVVELPEGEGVITADLSMQKLQKIRAAMPVLEHRKL